LVLGKLLSSGGEEKLKESVYLNHKIGTNGQPMLYLDSLWLKMNAT
jgi:hypothetical protein